MITASIIGGSGYTGGQVLRLLLGHPEVSVVQVSSRRRLGEFVYQTHPNLRKQTELKFCDPSSIQPVDILFLALPHGEAQKSIEMYSARASKIIDLSADFRLRNPKNYQQWYGAPHSAPSWIDRFVYGLPELHRQELRQASYVSGVGCNATACNLAMLPLIQNNLLDKGQEVIFEVKVGSSEGGAEGNQGSHHPERAGVIRTFSPFGHRHTAEVIQELGIEKPTLTMTSVDLVRGVLATAHGKVLPGVKTKDLWKAFRQCAAENPFIRIVKERRGVYRAPEPKILTGSNYADLGFDLDENSGHVVTLCAIDNLMKGAAGSAVQCMNLMAGFDENMGLEFPGLHPI